MLASPDSSALTSLLGTPLIAATISTALYDTSAFYFWSYPR
jgi:hypothetical protein